MLSGLRRGAKRKRDVMDAPRRIFTSVSIAVGVVEKRILRAGGKNLSGKEQRILVNSLERKCTQSL